MKTRAFLSRSAPHEYYVKFSTIFKESHIPKMSVHNVLDILTGEGFVEKKKNVKNIGHNFLF